MPRTSTTTGAWIRLGSRKHLSKSRRGPAERIPLPWPSSLSNLGMAVALNERRASAQSCIPADKSILNGSARKLAGRWAGPPIPRSRPFRRPLSGRGGETPYYPIPGQDVGRHKETEPILLCHASVVDHSCRYAGQATTSAAPWPAPCLACWGWHRAQTRHTKKRYWHLGQLTACATPTMRPGGPELTPSN